MRSILVLPAVNAMTVVLMAAILRISVPTSVVLMLPLAYLLLFAPCERPSLAVLKRALHAADCRRWRSTELQASNSSNFEN
jgi:hypothetical protein